MNALKRSAGILWIIAGPLAIYYLIRTAINEINKKPLIDTKIQWAVFVIVFLYLAFMLSKVNMIVCRTARQTFLIKIIEYLKSVLIHLNFSRGIFLLKTIHLTFAALRRINVFIKVCHFELIHDNSLIVVNHKHSFCICIATGPAKGNSETGRRL